MRFSISEEIALPVDQVFTLISNLGRALPKIDPDMQEVTQLTGGEIGIGTEWSEKFTGPLHRKTTVRSKVVAFQPPNLFRLSFKTAGLSGTLTFNCESLDEDRSHLTLTMDASPPLWGWLTYPLAKKDVKMRESVRLRNFKKLAESGEL